MGDMIEACKIVCGKGTRTFSPLLESMGHWNLLPQDVVMVSNIESFKKELDTDPSITPS